MNEIIKNAAKDLIELEVLNLLYKDEKIGKALNKLSLEERQKIISELRADPAYQKALNDELSKL